PSRSFSRPVTINLLVQSTDVRNGFVRGDKNIDTESGNPYGVFIHDAITNLGAISQIEVDEVRMSLGPTTTGVAGIDEIYKTDPAPNSGLARWVEVRFVIYDSPHTVAIRTITTGDVDDLTFDSGFFVGNTGNLISANYMRLLAGQFRVIVN